MRILLEEHQYEVADVKDVLSGVDALENLEGKVSVHYVGYYYNSLLKDCVFILPKVMLKDVDHEERVFGKYRPEDIINLNKNNPLDATERNFIYKFAVWIYRTIVVYKNDRRNDTSIVYHKQIAEIGKGRKRLSNTYLDVLLSLIQFNKDNQSFFFTIVKNIHSGYNKINWNRTIGQSTPLLQGGSPIYLNPINKRRQINFDEELLIIFFSILNYLADEYGFPKQISCQFQLITGKRFDTYLNGYGKRRLLQIKYKYFSDKALQLWQLCYAFFDETRKISVNTDQREYLLVKSFYVVFESIIDELIGDNPLPDGMQKKQEDGKIVDHLYTAKSLIDSENKQTYYIGDSKYYKIGHQLGDESIYKQYTYARNLIQWNLDIFNNGKEPQSKIRLRDDVTEGYNIIPNFFISAKMDESFDYGTDGLEASTSRDNRHSKKQFDNRLFDRDTMLLFHYDVNFLYILSLYARNHAGHKAQWKQEVREKFTRNIQEWLEQDYGFYAMKAHPDVDGKTYIRTHFQELLGKIYTPYQDPTLYSLALDKDPQYEEDNRKLVKKLSQYFYIEECSLGTQPEQALEKTMTEGFVPAVVRNGVLMVMMENYDQKFAYFGSKGQLAIGIKPTKESMKIIEHLKEIGYVLFHHRSREGQHLFPVVGDCRLAYPQELEKERYKIVKERKIFIAFDLDVQAEMDNSLLDCTLRKFEPVTRYDAQYAAWAELLPE